MGLKHRDSSSPPDYAPAAEAQLTFALVGVGKAAVRHFGERRRITGKE